MKSNVEKQILAITNKIRKGKAKSPAKAKAKIREISYRRAIANWLWQ